MTANSSTTDSEMATTDHTLGRFRFPGPGDATPRTPPEPSCHQPGPPMRRLTHRPSGGGRTPRAHPPPRANDAVSHGNSRDHPHREFDRIVSIPTQCVRH
ncbi:hypothetical protein GCM10010398_06820 [Streptomyces fimbriatus]